MSVAPVSRELVGREPVLHALERALRTDSRVTLIGPPGVGKSALAEIATRSWRSDRTLIRVRAPRRRQHDFVSDVLHAAGLGQLDHEGQWPDALLGKLDQTGTLLWIDGAEAARDTVASAVRELTELTSVHCLITSRVRLDCAGERVISVSPLASPDAVRMLRTELQRRAPGHEIDTSDAEALVRKLGGLPLAIELAVARLATLGVATLLSTTSSLDHDIVGELLESSWRLLTAPARQALAILSVFRGGFDLGAASALLGADARRELQALVAASLVMFDPRAARFELLEPVRADAERRAREWGIDARAARLHAAHFSAHARASSDDAACWSKLALDRDNLRAAFATLLIDDEPAAQGRLELAHLARALDMILVTAGHAAEHREMLELTMQKLDTGELRPQRAALALSLGRFHALRGRHAVAEAAFRDAASWSSRPGDVGWAQALSAFSLRALHRFDDAWAQASAALEAAARSDDPRLACMAQQSLGLIALERADYSMAFRAFERGLAGALLHDSPRLAAIARANLGTAELRIGNLEAASALLADARASFLAIGDRFHVARVQTDEARIAIARGLFDEAETLLEQALACSIEHADHPIESEARLLLARVAHARGDLRDARIQLERARLVALRTDDRSLHQRLEQTSALVQPGPDATSIQIAHGGEWAVIGDRFIDLRRRGPLRKLLLALAEHRCAPSPARGLSALSLVEAGWPGERPLGDSGLARVYMAIRRLRALGLGELLQTNDEGYGLDTNVTIRWVEVTAPQSARSVVR